MTTHYVLTAYQFDELCRIHRSVADGNAVVRHYVETGNMQDGYPQAAGYGKATLALADHDIEEVLKNVAIIYGADPFDNLSECMEGPHFYDPEEYPDHFDTSRCPECQPANDAELEADRIHDEKAQEPLSEQDYTNKMLGIVSESVSKALKGEKGVGA
jgi:hypothetical protein